MSCEFLNMNDKVLMPVYPLTGNGTYHKFSTLGPCSVRNEEVKFV